MPIICLPLRNLFEVTITIVDLICLSPLTAAQSLVACFLMFSIHGLFLESNQGSCLHRSTITHHAFSSECCCPGAGSRSPCVLNSKPSILNPISQNDSRDCAGSEKASGPAAWVVLKLRALLLIDNITAPSFKGT